VQGTAIMAVFQHQLREGVETIFGNC